MNNKSSQQCTALEYKIQPYIEFKPGKTDNSYCADSSVPFNINHRDMSLLNLLICLIQTYTLYQHYFLSITGIGYCPPYKIILLLFTILLLNASQQEMFSFETVS